MHQKTSREQTEEHCLKGCRPTPKTLYVLNFFPLESQQNSIRSFSEVVKKSETVLPENTKLLIETRLQTFVNSTLEQNPAPCAVKVFGFIE